MKAAREAWFEGQPDLDPARLVFLDETWTSTNMARTRGRSPRGERLRSPVPHGHWKATTFVGGLTARGFVAPYVTDGAMNGAIFKAWIEQMLAPELRPGDVVIMDNLAAHKARAVRDALAAAGIHYRYLPAYSPDLNPIEPCWAKLKARLRARGARTLAALEAELSPALATVTSQDATGWFRLCGYGPPN